MTSKYVGKYYKLDDLVFHVKDVHSQFLTFSSWVEIDDWVGDWPIGNKINLNSDNVLFDFSYASLNMMKEIEQKDFIEELKEEMEYSISQIKQGIGFAITFFKKTNERKRILNSYYGIKP